MGQFSQIAKMMEIGLVIKKLVIGDFDPTPHRLSLW
jgi:hypothetical protein